MERQSSNETGRGRGIALSLAWEAIGITIVIFVSVRILNGHDGGGSLAGLAGGIGILGLAVWDHVTTAGRGMARAAQNRWWLVVTGVVALILAVVVIGAIG